MAIDKKTEIAKSISWGIEADYLRLITKPELNAVQRDRHARIPALQAAWDQYMTMWDITHGD